MMFRESTDDDISCAGAGGLGVYVQNLRLVPQSGLMVVGVVGGMLGGPGGALSDVSASGGQMRSVLSGAGTSEESLI